MQMLILSPFSSNSRVINYIQQANIYFMLFRKHLPLTDKWLRRKSPKKERMEQNKKVLSHTTRDGMKAFQAREWANELYQGIPTFHNSFWKINVLKMTKSFIWQRTDIFRSINSQRLETLPGGISSFLLFLQSTKFATLRDRGNLNRTGVGNRKQHNVLRCCECKWNSSLNI